MNSPYSPGAQLGPYELLLPLSESGPTQAWVARLVGSGGFRAHVALKAIPRACFDDMPTEHLLLEQAALAAQVHHPNLAQVLDLGEQDDALYVATEWVDGESLRALLTLGASRGPMPLSIAVNLVGQLCRGLHEIHELKNADGAPANAVHGHVSPQNVLISYNGTVKLSDFGIARVLDRLSFLSGPNEHNHKLTFAAPEQLSGGVVDRRSDVFGVGVLLYLLTTSSHPFQGGDVRATLHNICSGQAAPRPETVLSDYPANLSSIVARALEKAPDARFQSAMELVTALEHAMPTCFHSSCDQALATYVDELCSARRLDLHARIHAAEVRFNRIRTSMPVGRPSMHASLRAVSIDPNETAPLERVSDSIYAKAFGARAFYQAKLRRFAAPAAAMAGAFLLSVGLLHAFGGAEKEHEARPAAPASEVASLPELGVRSLPVSARSAPVDKHVLQPAESGLKVESAPRVVPAAPPLPITSIASLPLAPRAAQVRNYAPRSAAPPRAAAKQESASPASAAAPAQAQPPVNPWDPSTFGGRH
ncbi:MAG TPA: serine/threonine-protein kinase [Polyangiaceae bacterium]|nr:serine/threonine-protein kinase [Polyangiaceae bacterium]